MSTDIRNPNGPKIKKLRELRNFTQEYMANKLGMSQVNYSRIEQGKVKVKPEKMEAIAGLLGITEKQIEQFDERIIFNIQKADVFNHNSTIQHLCHNSQTINHYTIDSKLERLYEEKIKWMDKRIIMLENELAEYQKGTKL